MKPSGKIFTGLDVGTTKICCIIGMRDEDQRSIRILGIGSHPSQGLERGMVSNIEQTVAAIQQATRKASAIATTEPDNVFVGIAGEHISCENSEAEIEIDNPARGVSEAERDLVLEKARPTNLEPGREAIQIIPQEYICDAQTGIKDPVNVRCHRLGVRVHVIIAAVAAAQNIVHCVNQAGLKTCDIVLQSLASSVAVLNDEVKDLGCVLVDIGGGTTDISVFREGSIRFSGVIPEGGDVVTRAVADGLQISRYDAENLKKRFGHCRSDRVDPEEIFQVVAALKQVPVPIRRVELARIIESRMTRILMQTRDLLDEHNLLNQLHAGVVLTGGASLTSGLVELTEDIFDKPVRVGTPEGLKGMSGHVGSPIYATGVGLVEYGIMHGRQLSGRLSLMDHIKAYIRNLFDYY